MKTVLLGVITAALLTSAPVAEAASYGFEIETTGSLTPDLIAKMYQAKDECARRSGYATMTIFLSSHPSTQAMVAVSDCTREEYRKLGIQIVPLLPVSPDKSDAPIPDIPL